MWLTGTNIGSTVNFKVQRNFRPRTRLALKWIQTSDGSYVAADRGATSDVYEADIDVYGQYATLDTLVSAIQDNRSADSHVLNISNVKDDERIFGANINYSSGVDMTVLDYGTIEQNTWHGFGLSMRVRALSPTFTGSTAMPTLQYLNIGYISDSTVGVNKHDTYNGTYTYYDHLDDAGTFRGTFLLSSSNMASIRNYLRIIRGYSFQINSISGVDNPYGPRRSFFPATVRCVKWDDLGLWGEQNWLIGLELAEVRS